MQRRNTRKRPARSGASRPQSGRNSAAKARRTRQSSRPSGTAQAGKRKQSRKPAGRKPFKKTGHPKQGPFKAPRLDTGTIRVIPIGGNEEVGRNMTIFEYEDDIVILDMGLQFPEENMPGIDYIVPNIKYLEGKEKNVRGVIFSHGHLDHIGAAPILLEKLGYPPIIAMPLTLEMIKHRVEDYKKGHSKFLKAIQVQSINDKIKLGKFTAGFFQVEHSIMDSMGTTLETAAGTIIHAGDWTMEREEDDTTHVHYHQLKDVKRPSILMLESLGSIKQGRHSTHQELYDTLTEILKKAKGRVIIATFGSQVERVKWVIAAAGKLGKKVALDGYSMKKNIELATKLGYVKPDKNSMIDIHKSEKYPDNKVVIVCTGAQGEENAALNRIVSGRHRTISLRKTDTVIFSSSVIPGNERTIQRIKDNIYRQADHVIHGDIMDVHVSGHGTRRDIVDMLDQVKPDYYLPVYANHFFLKEAQWLAEEHGYPKDKILVTDNGHIVDFDKKGMHLHKVKAPTDYVFVDGLGISDSQHIVLRDRQVLAEDGMIVVIATVDSHKGTLVQNPDIISRGFVFLKDNRDLIEAVRKKVKKLIVESDPATWADTDQIRNDIRDKVGQLVFSKTEKRPMVLPVVIQV